MTSRAALVALFVAAIAWSAYADVYMHCPRGSNERYRGANNNQNRIFNSQNNANGGYNVGEPNANEDGQVAHPKFYAGSKLRIEWTSQHSCGPVGEANAYCNFVIQYMCGGPGRTYNGQAFTLKDTDANDRHEPEAYRQKCDVRQRNNGLFIANRNLNANANAQTTRQNNNGQTRGNECQEERDYWPYWHPSPWKDVVVFTANKTQCKEFTSRSQNVQAKEECECPNWRQGCAANNNCWKVNNEAACATTTDNNQQCVWVEKTHRTFWTAGGSAAEEQLGEPECLEAPILRDNHLGNDPSGEMPHYTWTLPTPEQACGSVNATCTCTLRLRYNMSSYDLANLRDWQLPAGVSDADLPDDVYWGADYRLNGQNKIKMNDAPVTIYFSDNTQMTLGPNREVIQIGHNENQVGRTFQDRAHLFDLMPDPRTAATGDRDIHNVIVRGKVGNIVQTYPAVEYDFCGNKVEANSGDFVHFQWTGSNSNEPGQGQEGNNQVRDRSNLALLRDNSLLTNVPMPEAAAMASGFFDVCSASTGAAVPNPANDPMATLRYFWTGGYSGDMSTLNQQMTNVSPTFYGHRVLGGTDASPNFLCPKDGIWNYFSSRNNNFSNRGQKATLCVGRACPANGTPSAGN